MQHKVLKMCWSSGICLLERAGFMKKSSSIKHYEEFHTFQEKCHYAVNKFYKLLSRHANSFKDCSEELINIKTSDVMNNDDVASI